MDRSQLLIETLSKKLGDIPTKDAVLAEYKRILGIQWFKPMAEPPKEAEKTVKLALKLFGVEAEIEYKKLKKVQDWDAARDAARGAAWDAAWGAARGAARDAAWDAAWDAAFYTRVKHICFGLKLDAKFRLHAEARWKVWEKGYCLLCDVNGTLYVYKNP